VVKPTPAALPAPVLPPPPPRSRVERLVIGVAAMTVPQTVSQRLGVFEVGGGKGLLWFTDVDTLFFDIILVAVVVAFFRFARPHRLRNPAFWMVLLVTIVVGLAIAYTVSNFGTLFRIRGTIYAWITMIPLALVNAVGPREQAADSDPVR
jgi:hypothetical protein